MTPPALVCLGETMALVASSRPGLLRHQRELLLGTGGSESNVAIAASRLGTATAWTGRVGDDELGELVLRDLRAEQVHVQATVDPQRPTGLMVKERRSAEASRVWYHRTGSAGSALDVADLDRGLVEGAGVLHVSGITFSLSAQARDTARTAVDWARAAGVAVSLDLNYRSRLWGVEEYAATLGELLPDVDVVFGSPHEFAPLVGEGEPRAQLERMTARGPAEVVLKLGAEGACALVDGELLSSPAVPVQVVDTVGAGDAFVAGWLAERLAGLAPADRLRTAVGCGALACTVEGDWEGSPTRRELAALGRGDDAVQR
ncbi:sugar kinase [Modestobacter sp. L9-4]|uniref:sugar kinase n=1 Tax=Modestobacter sp. L9-4 TaxID=2851567 RepID=UPI001C777775|nr:sugar kinase [Modestobacter sp. L9-4]QXG75569.1 sugar kinase [Modestobacter sp. L9-4]